MSIRNLIKNSVGDKFSENIYIAKYHDYLMEWGKSRDSERSSGFHASSLAEKNFCLVRAVLSEMQGDSAKRAYSPRTLSIFWTGNVIHEKHLDYYRDTGVAKFIEQQFTSDLYDMTATPDAVIDFLGTATIIEIKSMNTYEFKKLNKAPNNAYVQVQIYMGLLGIPQSLIVVEDKNTQELKVFKITYNVEDSMLYMKRRLAIKKCVDAGKIPYKKRICENATTNKKCRMHSVCWGTEK